MKSTLICLLTLCLALLGCQGDHAGGSTKPELIYPAKLDSLTTAFLVAHKDTTDIWSDTLISQLSHVLRGHGIDTLLYFRNGCSGCEILTVPGEKDCACNTTEIDSYLFWKARGLTYIKKLDCCANHAAILASASPFDFYYQNQLILKGGQQFYLDLQHYNETHPGKPRFLPSGPIHDDVSYIQLLSDQDEIEIHVRAGEYDSVGVPLFLDYPWRRKQWEWAKNLERIVEAPAK